MSDRSTIPPNDRILVKQPEAADLLSMSTRHLRRLTDRGEIPAIGKGRGILYAVEDLHAYARRARGGA
jgi:excisionase family DNA binding protein